MSWTIKCAVTESYLSSVSFLADQMTLTLTKLPANAVPFPTLESAKNSIAGLAAPQAWPDFDWTPAFVCGES